jgi:hypothetical protein
MTKSQQKLVSCRTHRRLIIVASGFTTFASGPSAAALTKIAPPPPCPTRARTGLAPPDACQWVFYDWPAGIFRVRILIAKRFPPLAPSHQPSPPARQPQHAPSAGVVGETFPDPFMARIALPTAARLATWLSAPLVPGSRRRVRGSSGVVVFGPSFAQENTASRPLTVM